MKIVDRINAVNEIVNIILSKARYQKVVFCLDKNSDMLIVDKVCDLVGREAVIIKYYYNKNNIENFFKTINNGVRVVVYDVSIKHFYSLQNTNAFLLNVFVSQSDFVLPYIANIDSLYGENVLICDKSVKDYNSIVIMYELALSNLWSGLLQGVSVNTNIFKRIDASFKCNDFHIEIMNIFKSTQSNLNNNYYKLDEDEIAMYEYVKLNCILKMLQMLDDGEERYVDFYKDMRSSKDVDKAYNLIIKYNVIEVLRQYCNNLIKITNIIINRIKILINKYLNNRVNLNKCIKIIKNEAMCLNMDNLLYISYILNCI